MPSANISLRAQSNAILFGAQSGLGYTQYLVSAWTALILDLTGGSSVTDVALYVPGISSTNFEADFNSRPMSSGPGIELYSDGSAPTHLF